MNTQMTHQESLATIQNMIDNAKSRFQENGELFILWGWLAVITSMTHFVLIKFDFVSPEYAWVVWILMAIVGNFFQYRFLKKKESRQAYKTILDIALSSLWMGIMIVFLFTTFYAFSGQINWNIAYGFYLAMFGLGSFVTGGMIKFRPLMTGGFLSVVLGGFSAFVNVEYILPLMALGITVSYLIPGYMLKRQNAKLQMNNYLIIALFALGLSLTSCSTNKIVSNDIAKNKEFRNNMDSWIGKSMDELLAEWGKPNKITEGENGEKYLVYSVSETQSWYTWTDAGGNTFTVPQNNISMVRFIFDNNRNCYSWDTNIDKSK
jgi:hypothetical protein